MIVTCLFLQAKGEVAQVIQKGYKIKDRVLRAAKVGVAKGGGRPGWKFHWELEQRESVLGRRRSLLRSLQLISFYTHGQARQRERERHKGLSTFFS